MKKHFKVKIVSVDRKRFNEAFLLIYLFFLKHAANKLTLNIAEFVYLRTLKASNPTFSLFSPTKQNHSKKLSKKFLLPV
jgi:hypothetical protein